MEESGSSHYGLLVNNLESSVGNFKGLKIKFLEFITNNPDIIEKNKSQYDALYEKIGDFYIQAIFMSRINPHNFLIGDRTDICRKKHLAKQIKHEFSYMLVCFESISHSGEDTPFYEEVRKNIGGSNSSFDGEYDYLTPDANPEY